MMTILAMRTIDCYADVAVVTRVDGSLVDRFLFLLAVGLLCSAN